MLGVLVIAGVLFAVLRRPKKTVNLQSLRQEAAAASGGSAEEPESSAPRSIEIEMPDPPRVVWFACVPAWPARTTCSVRVCFLCCLVTASIRMCGMRLRRPCCWLTWVPSRPPAWLRPLQKRVRIEGTNNPAAVKKMLREELVKIVGPDMDRELKTAGSGGNPGVVLVVGVNGVGKTTTVGKIARVMVADGRSLILGAADTFRAAASEQLTTWGDRVGVKTVRSEKEGADPASVAFDAVKTGKDEGVDTVLVDTAGRLQNKAGLMDQLGKIKRVIEKEAPVTEVLLVIDATTGQNGMIQAKVFGEIVDVTGIVLTKLDGTAKGGIVVAIQEELGVPVKLIGLGEGPDDLAPFDPEAFVDALLD